MLLTILRWLAGFLWLLTYYIAFFMYEDEEGRWQNVIESLWIAVNDKSKVTGSKTNALFNQIATAVTWVFDRIFGRKLFSVRFITISASYSFAGVFLAAFLVLRLYFIPLPSELSKNLPTLLMFAQWTGLTFLVLAVLPSLFSSRWLVGLNLLPLAFMIFGVVLNTVKTHHVAQKHLIFLAMLLFALLSDLLLIVLIRFTVRWLAEQTTVPRIVRAILIQLGVIGCLIVVPWSVSVCLTEAFGSKFAFIGSLAVFNIFTGLWSGLFFLSLLFVLVHRLVWPMLSRLIYPLARHQLIRNRKLMASIGTACFLFALHLVDGPVKRFAEWIDKML